MKRLSLLVIACCATAGMLVAHLGRGTPSAVTNAEIQVPCSSGDSTAAWNAAVSQAISGSDRIVHLLACEYHFYSAPAPISHGIEVLGQGLYSTFLERDYSPGHGCSRAACEFIQVDDIGETIKDLAIFARAGTSGGWGLHVISSDSRRGGFVSVDNVYISGYGSYSLPVYLDGLRRQLPPRGIRKVNFTNVYVFNGTWYGFECWNCIAMSWHGGGVWQGFGTTQQVVVGGSLSALDMIAANFNGTVQYWAGDRMR